MSRNSRLEVEVETTVFTVTYLGSDDCRALRGEDVTEPVVKTFIYGDNAERLVVARTVVLDVGQKDLTLTELVQKKNKIKPGNKVKRL